jgi:hypothetical protein
MRLLFDTSPTEETGKVRKKRIAPRPAAVATPAAENAPKIFSVPTRIMGRVDGEVAGVCLNCEAQCHDIIANEKGRWFLECCLCGTGQWILAIDDRLDEPEPEPGGSGVFAWPEDGSRFSGKSLDEIKPEIISWAAENEPNESVKKACQEYLAGIGRVV